MADDDLDLGGVTMDLSLDALLDKLIPGLVKKLQSNVALQRALANSMLPQIRSLIAQNSKSTGNSLPPASIPPQASRR